MKPCGAIRGAALSGVMLVQACSGTPGPEPDSPLLPPLEGEEGPRCIQLTRISSTRVIDNRSIEFQLKGGKTYINVLPRKCAGLRPGRPFMYRTSLNQLCDLDLITLLDTGGFGFLPMGSCGLGRFYPTLTGGPAILEEQDE